MYQTVNTVPCGTHQEERERISTLRGIERLTSYIKQCPSSMWYIPSQERVLTQKGTLFQWLTGCIKHYTQFDTKRRESVSTSRDIIDRLTSCIKQCTVLCGTYQEERELEILMTYFLYEIVQTVPWCTHQEVRECYHINGYYSMTYFL